MAQRFAVAPRLPPNRNRLLPISITFLSGRNPRIRGFGWGEGRTAEGSPGWDGGGAAYAGDAASAEALSPPPGPLTRADLPLEGGGGRDCSASTLPSLAYV